MAKKNTDGLPAEAGAAPTVPAETGATDADAAEAGAVRAGVRDQFLSTLSLVCRIPLPCTFTFSARRMDLWLPVTALFQMLLFALAFGAFGFLFRDIPLAVLAALILQYGAFNLFHFDGLLDTADAFLGAYDQEKRFQILKDPRLGVYAVFAAAAYLSTKFFVLQALFNRALISPLSQNRVSPPGQALLSPLFFLILLFPLAGKTAAALIPGLFSPAKPEGLGALAAGSRVPFTVLGFCITLALYMLVPLFLVLSGLFSGLSDTAPSEFTTLTWQAGRILSWVAIVVLLLVLSASITGLLLGRLYRKGLGGYTGDTLGAAVELGELLYLLTLFLLVQWIRA